MVPLQIQLDGSLTCIGAAAEIQSPYIDPMNPFSGRSIGASRQRQVARDESTASMGSCLQYSLYPSSSRRERSAKRTCQYASFAAKNAALVPAPIAASAALRIARVQYSLWPWTSSMRRRETSDGSASRSESATYAMS